MYIQDRIVSAALAHSLLSYRLVAITESLMLKIEF